MSDLRPLSSEEVTPSNVFVVESEENKEEETEGNWFSRAWNGVSNFLLETQGIYKDAAGEVHLKNNSGSRGGLGGALENAAGVGYGQNHVLNLTEGLNTSNSFSYPMSGMGSSPIPSTFDFDLSISQPWVNKEGEKTKWGFHPQQAQIYKAISIDPLYGLGQNVTGLVLEFSGSKNKDPKQTSFGKFLTKSREQATDFVGAKQDWEFETQAEKSVLNDLWGTVGGIAYTSAGMAAVAPALPSWASFSMVPGYDYLPGAMQSIFRWTSLLAIEEGLNTAFEDRNIAGSIFDLWPDHPLALKPEDTYSQFLSKSFTGNLTTGGVVGGTLGTIFQTPNILRYVKEKNVLDEVSAARTWLVENNFQDKDGTRFFKNSEPEVKTETSPEVKTETSPEVKTETETITEKPKPKSVNEAIENLIDKPEADVVVRAIDELDDVSAEKIANSEGKVLDQLELEIENQTKLVEDDEAAFEEWLKNPPEEYRELFQEIEETTKSSYETIAKQKELFEGIRSGLEEQDKLLKEGSQYDELSPTDKKKVDLEMSLRGQNISSPINKAEATFIPDDLLLGKATYGMAELEFGSRIDQAAWLLRPGRKRYPAVAKQITELAQKNGIDLNELRAHGTKVHESIKAQVKDKTGSAKASPDNTAGLTFNVQDQKFGRVVATEKAPDPVVSYVDQWASMSFKDLKKLSSPKTNEELFNLIRKTTGKEYRQFTKKDIIAGLQKLREKGITVRPQNTKPKLKAQREETKRKIVQKAIDQGEVKPSSTKLEKREELSIDPDNENLTVEEIMAQELALAKKYQAEDAAKQAALKEADRKEMDYYNMSLEEKKQHGLLDGWERQTEAEIRIDEIKTNLEYLNDDIAVAERMIEERLERGLGFSEEFDEGLETLNIKKRDLEIELARLQGDDSVEFKNIKQEVRIMNFDPYMSRVMKNREALQQMLADLIRRIGGDDVKFTFKDEVNIITEAPAEWGGKANFEGGKEAGIYDTLNDHITIYEVTNGLKISEIQERMGTSVHEPFHRIQFGYMTLEEMKIFDTIDGQKRIKLFSQLNPNVKTEFSQKATATLEKMTVGFQEYSMLRLSGMDPFEFAVTNKIGTWLDANFPRVDGNSWQLGKFHNTLTTIAKVWDRIFEVVRAFGNYAKGRGFKTVDSIYEEAFSGLMAKKRKFDSAVNVIYSEMESARLMDKINKRIDLLKIAQKSNDPAVLKRLNDLYQKDVTEFEAFKTRHDDLFARANVLERWKSDNEGFLKFVDDAIAKKKQRIDELKTQALQGGC